MPINTDQSVRSIDPGEKAKLASLLTELERRGLGDKVREQADRDVFLKRTFHTDENGFFIRRDGKQFSPKNQNQLNFIRSTARFCAYISGRGGGKSAASAQKALCKISQGLSGAVLNPKFEDFKDSTWPELREWIPWDNVIPSHRYKANLGWEPHQPFRVTFTNGAFMICKGLNDPSGARGPNINWLWYDEAGNDRDGLAWQIAIASVRKGDSPQAWISTTPKGKLHWIYDFFIKEEAQELLSEFEDMSDRPLLDVFYSTISENLENLDPGFVISLKKAYVPGSYLYKQEVDGEFVTEGGALGDAAWFTGKILPNAPEKVVKRVRYWDLAASEKKISGKKKTDPDFTSGTKLSMFDDLADDRAFCIEDQVAGQIEWEGIKSLILTTAIRDGVYVPIYVEQEPGAGGKNQIAELKSFIQKELGISYQVIGHLPEGDKIMRANPWFAEAAQGYFYMVFGSWNTKFLEQLGSFPETKHDDLVDGVSGARAVISPYRSYKKIRFLHLGGNLDEKKNKEDTETKV